MQKVTIRTRIAKRHAPRTVFGRVHIAGKTLRGTLIRSVINHKFKTIVIRARALRHTKLTITGRVRIVVHRLQTVLVQAHTAALTKGQLQVNCRVSRHRHKSLQITATLTASLYTSWLLTEITYTTDATDTHNAQNRMPRALLPNNMVVYLWRPTTPGPDILAQTVYDQVTAYTGWHVLGGTITEITGATHLLNGSTLKAYLPG